MLLFETVQTLLIVKDVCGDYLKGLGSRAAILLGHDVVKWI